jgi:hypothetical protein
VAGRDGLIPFSGSIHSYKAELTTTSDDAAAAAGTTSSTIDRRHYVEFEEDDDQLWFNMELEEEAGRLSWQENEYSIATATAAAAAPVTPVPAPSSSSASAASASAAAVKPTAQLWLSIMKYPTTGGVSTQPPNYEQEWCKNVHSRDSSTL